ncbi:MAG: CcdB family protein [Endozoicomonas sp.]|uniref:CcdB family protein n=1 Tax=Endozoicomonas sp. TaxID=1892382 RepID=UPI003D9AEFFA
MAQFDVYENTNKQTSDTYPYLLNIQADFLDDLGSSVVIPLIDRNHFDKKAMKVLMLTVELLGTRLLVMTPQMASVPRKLLKNKVGNLGYMRQEIIESLDFLVGGV